jgi:peptidyl-prolyl cis-trans isomerase B (cyclophilin B)
MVFLAQQGFYTDSDCFRLTTDGIFVLQCGSPNNDGTGGPGYELPDENLPSATGVNYPRGTVAMANAGPGTGGSQFFIVYKDTTLPASYTIWGTVVSGLDVVEKVAGAGVAAGNATPTDGSPAQPIVITKATTSDKPAG